MSRLKGTDDFGARMKAYEAVETTRQLDVHLPIYARKHLVHETHARIGYTQSDEISLVWQAEGAASDVLFSGKVQKLVSVLASMSAAKFATVIPAEFANRLPHFDCRVFQLPSQIEAANAFLWRAMDARKNAISMVAQHYFSHNTLFKQDQRAMLAMLERAGVDFDSYPERARRGTFLRRVNEMRTLTSEEFAKT